MKRKLKKILLAAARLIKTPAESSFLLTESGGFLLKEDGGKFIKQV